MTDSRTLRVDQALLVRLRGWLHSAPSGLIALALVTGLGAGVGAIGFRDLIGLGLANSRTAGAAKRALG